jgi:succinoglycan biosynthesis protein ExoM
MNRVTICIPTYKRTDLLDKLIQGILSCNISRTLISGLDIVVVDNDPAASAEATVRALVEKCAEGINLQYSCYSVKGLANVRNELLRIAGMSDPDFIVFIDDDEFVTPDWLNELVGTIILNKADLVMGPVISVFDEKVPEYISRWIERPSHDNNSKMDFIRSGNLIMRAKTLNEFNVRFDPRFNMTGGEDSYFGSVMLSKGASIYWAAKAIAYETVPSGRANIRWLFKRYYNGANVYTRILGLDRKYTGLIKKTGVSLLYILAGGLGSVMALLPLSHRYWGILKLAEGFGGLAGLFNIEYQEYK